MTTDINRVPRGVPNAGEWTARPLSESPVTLPGQDDAFMRLFDRDDGSYLHPSPAATASHCIRFWSSVSIPDEIIAQAEDAYYDDRSREISEDYQVTMDDWGHRWVEDNPAPKRKADIEAYNARYAEEYEQYSQAVAPKIRARRPSEMGAYDSRQLVRAYQMISNRPHPDKFPIESEKVLDHPIQLFDEVLTVHEISEKYHLERIKGFILKIRGDGSQEAATAAMLAEMKQTNDILGEMGINIAHQRVEAQDSYL